MTTPDKKPIEWDKRPSLATHWDSLRQWWVEIGNKADDPVMIFDEGAKLAGWQTRCWLKTADVVNNPDRFVPSPSSRPLWVLPDGLVDFADNASAWMQATIKDVPSTGRQIRTEPRPIPAEVVEGGVGEFAALPLTGNYAALSDVLSRAFEQAANGKGAERHGLSLPFPDQPMLTLAGLYGVGFCYGQAGKKMQEALILPTDQAVHELLGAINFIAGAVIHLERNRT